MDKDTSNDTNNSLDSLESVGPTITPAKLVDTPPPTKKPRPKLPRKALPLAASIIFLIVLGLTTLVLTKNSTPKKPTKPSFASGQTQTISAETLKKVLVNGAASSEVQQITISPKVLFTNDVTVQGNLSAKGTADFQGAVRLDAGLTVRGTLNVIGPVTFGNNLSVAGTIITGGLSVGSLSVANVTISSNLTVGGHILPGGAKPSATTSVAAGGGSVVVVGNDTAGTVTINTGSGASVGEMAIVSFKTPFGGTPKVQLTPINTAAAQLQYYATRSASFFSINSANSPSANSAYSFDYLVTQ